MQSISNTASSSLAPLLPCPLHEQPPIVVKVLAVRGIHSMLEHNNTNITMLATRGAMDREHQQQEQEVLPPLQPRPLRGQ